MLLLQPGQPGVGAGTSPSGQARFRNVIVCCSLGIPAGLAPAVKKLSAVNLASPP